MRAGNTIAAYVVILACVGLLALVITGNMRGAIGPLAVTILPWVLLACFLL
jgi:hypothetical protein